MTSNNNVYAPPKAAEESGAVKHCKLYKLSGIALAAFFGTPIAGGYLISRNYRVLGMPSEAKAAMLYAVVGTVGFMVLLTIIEIFVSLPGTSYSVPQALSVYFLAKHYQGSLIESHANNKADFFSNWRAFGISLLVLLATLAVLIPVLMAWPEVFGV